MDKKIAELALRILAAIDESKLPVVAEASALRVAFTLHEARGPELLNPYPDDPEWCRQISSALREGQAVGVHEAA